MDFLFNNANQIKNKYHVKPTKKEKATTIVATSHRLRNNFSQKFN
jgi:hypothetical protein